MPSAVSFHLIKIKLFVLLLFCISSCNPFGTRKSFNKTYVPSSITSIGIVFRNSSAIGGKDLTLSDSLFKEAVFYELSTRLNNKKIKCFAVKNYEVSYEDIKVNETADLFLIADLSLFRTWGLTFPNRYVAVVATKLMDKNYIVIGKTKFNTAPTKLYGFRHPILKIGVKVATTEALIPITRYLNKKELNY